MTTTLSQNIIALTKNEQSRLFRMLTDNSDLLATVLPDIPLISAIRSGNFNLDSNDPVVRAYLDWKNR